MKTETQVGIVVIIAIGIFLYLSINIGALRLDKSQYNIYKTYFDDTGGLDTKAPIKIAGVDVGFVDSITLLEDGKAEVILRVSKTIKLSRNAYAAIAQEGLIGTKTLIIDPGDPSTGILLPGSILAVPGKSPTTVNELLDQFKDIATSIQDIASTFKNVFATSRGEEEMKAALSGIAKASNRMSDFSEILDKMLKRNEDNINATLKNFSKASGSLSDGIPTIVTDLHETLPSFRKNFDKITLAFADDTLPKLSDASTKVGTAFETIDDTAVQARETFNQAEQVVEKINTGKGVLGKLINEDETYDDIKKTIKGLKDYLTKAQSMVIDVDMHSETLLANDWNSKGYFDIRLRPTDDYFYKFGLVSSQRGYLQKSEEYDYQYDDNGIMIQQDKVIYGDTQFGNAMKAHDSIEYSQQKNKVVRKKDAILFNLQFGKRFNRLALRMGLFENCFGFGCDYLIPTRSNNINWVTTLEAFDFKGTQRFNKYKPYKQADDRPNIKWMNKIYFMKHVYTTFGLDDMIGKYTCGPFIGGGFRFSDDDIKYIASSLPVGSIAK